MTDQNILLSRKDFPHFSSKTISDLFESNNFCDVTLFSNDGHLLNAHKIILSSGSLVFNKLISQSEQVINIDVSHSELILILKFIYTGNCEVELIGLPHFLATSKLLQIKGLITDVENETNNLEGDKEDIVSKNNERIFIGEIITVENKPQEIKPTYTTNQSYHANEQALVQTSSTQLLNNITDSRQVKVDHSLEEPFHEEEIEVIDKQEKSTFSQHTNNFLESIKETLQEEQHLQIAQRSSTQNQFTVCGLILC